MSQFVNCPECSVRNFADDEYCGACNAKLNASPPTKVNWNYILVVVSVLVLIYVTLFHNNGSKKNNTNISTEQQSSPAYSLAVINDGTVPNQSTVQLFTQLLESIQNKYPNRSKLEIANGLVASYNIVNSYKKDLSLLKFTNGFNSYSNEIKPQYLQTLTMEQSLALYLKLAYTL